MSSKVYARRARLPRPISISLLTRGKATRWRVGARCPVEGPTRPRSSARVRRAVGAAWDSGSTHHEGTTEMSWIDGQLLGFDTETTGVDTAVDRIVTVALVHRNAAG